MRKLVSFLKAMTFREYVFAICMLAAWIIYLIAFIRDPSKQTFIGGGCIVVVCFAFLCWTGENLPDQTVWGRFTDIAFVSLAVMFVTNISMAFCCYSSLEQIFSSEFLLLIMALGCIYLFLAVFFVLGVIGYKDERKQIH